MSETMPEMDMGQLESPTLDSSPELPEIDAYEAPVDASFTDAPPDISPVEIVDAAQAPIEAPVFDDVETQDALATLDAGLPVGDEPTQTGVELPDFEDVDPEQPEELPATEPLPEASRDDPIDAPDGREELNPPMQVEDGTADDALERSSDSAFQETEETEAPIDAKELLEDADEAGTVAPPVEESVAPVEALDENEITFEDVEDRAVDPAVLEASEPDELALNRQEAAFENKEIWSERPADDFGITTPPAADSEAQEELTASALEEEFAPEEASGVPAEWGGAGQNGMEREDSSGEAAGEEESHQSANPAADAPGVEAADAGDTEAPAEEEPQKSADGKIDLGSLEDGEEVIIEGEVDMEHLLPNAVYEHNGYTYETDEYGRPVSAEGKLHLEEGERTPLQTEIGHMGEEGDQGGHLIGARFGGAPDAFNIRPQAGSLNMGEYKALENEWARAVESGCDVQVNVAPQYEGDSIRPWAYEVQYSVDGQQAQTFFLNQAKN